MKIISTDNLSGLDKNENLWAYCGLDSMLTAEILSVLLPQLDPTTQATYDFSRKMQAPALEMMQRGFLIDMAAREDWISRLVGEIAILTERLNQFSVEVWGEPLNPNSPAQLKSFFYRSMALPEQFKYFRGQKTVSCNRDALENLNSYLYARPFISHILALRDRVKTLSVLRTGVDSDSRIRTSYNICGTETGRWSSSENAFHTGTNLQNIAPPLREIFIADPGHRLCYVDLEQAESRIVGLLCYAYVSGSAYLDACESGDLHTVAARMVWPTLVQDKKSAQVKFYRDFTYRDMAKRGGHGTNYFGKPYAIAANLKVKQGLIETFQKDYFKAFPEIRLWHYNVAKRLQIEGQITTLFGRRRHFFGRRSDDSTLREAIAYEPQSIVGDLLNEGLYRLWKHEKHRIQILAQIHDAVVFQYPESFHSEIPSIISHLLIPITGGSPARTITIPIEAKTGFNWANFSEGKNPDGLKNYDLADNRTRQRGPALSLLDRKFL